MPRSMKSGVVFWITSSTWVIPKQIYTVGIPPGWGARLAVNRFAADLRKLADS